MAQSATYTSGESGEGLGSLAAGYAPGEERPLGSYMLLTLVYSAGFGASLLALRRRGHALAERPSLADVAMAGVATHKLSRLLTKDKVTSFLRAPFTEFEEASGQGEVEERARGHGLRLAVGELLVCPYCVAQWIASGFAVGLVGAPRFTRLLGSVFVAHTISDFMQAAYRAAEDRA